MKQKWFTDEQVIGVLKVGGASGVVADLCRKHGTSSATLHAWKSKHGGLELSKACRSLNFKRVYALTSCKTDKGECGAGCWRRRRHRRQDDEPARDCVMAAILWKPRRTSIHRRGRAIPSAGARVASWSGRTHVGFARARFPNRFARGLPKARRSTSDAGPVQPRGEPRHPPPPRWAAAGPGHPPRLRGPTRREVGRRALVGPGAGQTGRNAGLPVSRDDEGSPLGICVGRRRQWRGSGRRSNGAGVIPSIRILRVVQSLPPAGRSKRWRRSRWLG